jgi:hypothetical protein
VFVSIVAGTWEAGAYAKVVGPSSSLPQIGGKERSRKRALDAVKERDLRLGRDSVDVAKRKPNKAIVVLVRHKL